MPVLRLELAPGMGRHLGAAPGAALDTVTDTVPDTVTGAAVHARRTLILAVCCLSLFMVCLLYTSDAADE